MNAGIKRNPVFWLMWILPGAAVLGGFATLAIAMQQADRALPSIYHWEGELLDADFDRARNAARLGLVADLRFTGSACELALHGAQSSQLRLMLTNGIDVHQDRLLILARSEMASIEPRAHRSGRASGAWPCRMRRSTWSLRAQVEEASDRIELRARSPEGPV